MVDSFFKYLQFERRYSPKTILSYQTDLHQFSEFLNTTYDEKKPERATYGAIRAWIVALVDLKLSPGSINRKIACLRSFFKFCMKQEVLEKDPMQKIRVLKTPKKLPHFVHEEDMAKLLDGIGFEDSLEGCRDRLIIELFYGTGIRLAELIGLKEHQVNLHERTIRVLGKRNKERVIPFSKNIVSIIKAYQTKKDKEVGNKNHGLLFVNNSGEPVYPMMVYRLVRKYLDQFTAVEKRSPHVLRHSFATHLLNKGAEINAVKDLLGHTSLAATQVYTHNSMEKLKKVFDQAHPKA
ncbi:MAG: tyrosine-type recombinase/integrase [Cyclobacteriaceae bacterium]|nr:tyrosine-type recombinase/integrase [Cyclobacteriaceae bacterium]MCB9237946.1 tyrosine-type recombinase/integrase [Flammeovirgaceae bacterium]MCB0499214.1 tyrosine-type recombinase/integrase [Cyclobacteriaceae bacterium]MCO5271903.1 tyrosine-type recombinase/integrase [Cyclobacteriaceae bacterium]MCW5902449.1 tyrosine-type recombinase/integrase [Cyclobacteriaceae bacterium]